MGNATQGTKAHEGHDTIQKSNLGAKHAGKHAFLVSAMTTSEGVLRSKELKNYVTHSWREWHHVVDI